MSVYSIILIAITLAYASHKILDIAAYFFDHKESIICNKPDHYFVNKLGTRIFVNTLKVGLFAIGALLIDNAIFSENWMILTVLLITIVMILPLDYL